MSSVPYIPLAQRRYTIEVLIGGKWRKVRSTKWRGGFPNLTPYRRVGLRWKKNYSTFDIQGNINVRAWARKHKFVKGVRARIVNPVPNLILDVGTRWPVLSLCMSLQRVARALRRKIMIREGTRTRAQQQAFWNDFAARNFAPPLVARPGTSNHEARNGEPFGRAADCGVQEPGVNRYDRGVNLADYPGAAALCRRFGIVFPVRGESWHAEEG